MDDRRSEIDIASADLQQRLNDGPYLCQSHSLSDDIANSDAIETRCRDRILSRYRMRRCRRTKGQERANSLVKTITATGPQSTLFFCQLRPPSFKCLNGRTI